MEETDNICFVCDKTISSEKWKYKLQVTATNRRNVPVADLIKQLVGEEYEVLVGERDAVCSICMNLLNLMDSLTDQLGEVESTLSRLLHSKYNLTSESTEFQVEYDDSILEDVEPLHKCDSCDFETKYEKEFNIHCRTHITSKPSKSSETKKPTPTVTKKSKNIISPPKQITSKTVTRSTPKNSLPKVIKKSTIKPHASKKKDFSASKKKEVKKSPASSGKRKPKKVPKPKKTKVVFQCSICDKIFSEENLIKDHAKKVHGNDKISVSEDEYEDIQTLESPDEEINSEDEVKNKKDSVIIPAKAKLDFLDDWEEDEENDDLTSPAKKLKSENNIAIETSKPPPRKRGRPRKTPAPVILKKKEQEKEEEKEEEEEDDDDRDTSSNPTCLFCHTKFSSFEAVQDHVKLSHTDKTTHLNIGQKPNVASPTSIASFEIDSTTDIVENKKQATVAASRSSPFQKTYKCNLCGIRKVSLQFIQQHIKAHKKKLSLQCKFCGITCKSVFALKVHSSKCHKAASIPKKCSFCKFKFFDAIQLKNHLRKVHYKEILKINNSSREKTKDTKVEKTNALALADGSSKSRLQKNVRGSGIKDSIKATDSSKISFSEVSSTSLETDSEIGSKTIGCAFCEIVVKSDLEMKEHVEKLHGIIEEEKRGSVSKSGGKGQIKCPECGVTVEKRSRLTDHLNRHKASTCLNLGICIFCDKLFLDKEQVVMHTNIIHENFKTKPECPICGKVYSHAKDMKTHYLKAHFRDSTVKLMKQVTDSKLNKAEASSSGSCDANDVYSKVFKELQDLTGEGNESEDTSLAESRREFPLSFSCPLCDFSSSNKVLLIDHLSSHTQNYCNICKSLFTPQESIKHIENHSIEFQDEKCSECKQTFHDELHLQYHVQSTHPERKPHKCGMCAKSYFSEKSMLTHKQTKHGQKSKKVFSCNECKKSFYSEKEYQTHVEFAHRLSLNCKYCDKTFSELEKLVVHERHHLKQVQSIYKCNICGKVLKTMSALKTHKNNHTSSNSQQCDVCSRSFKSFHALREHSAKHSDSQEKKYFCDICGKGFYFYDSHQRHRRIHLDPLLFQCKICRERFQTGQKLMEHKNTCKPNSEKCSKCGKTFTLNTDLKKHVCLP